MIEKIKKIIKENKEIITLILIILPSCLIIIKSSFFLPILISIIFSYFLYNIKESLIKNGIHKKISFIITYLMFFTFFLTIFLLIIPLIFKQLLSLFSDLPLIIQKSKILTYKIIEKYPYIFPQEQTNIIFSNIITYFQSIGKTLINASLLSIALIIKSIINILLIPILIFFFLKDYDEIRKWFFKTIPEKAKFWQIIWLNINKKIINYIRGKLIELVIITITNYILFKIYNIAYADLLSIGVGISVIIPYVGIIIISIPIIIISAVQFGLNNDFFYFNLFYIIIQFLDGNLLVPILFSEAVKLNPISIIISIIIFGSIFNIYGLFFAIPLAITIKAIIKIYLTPKNKINL